MPVTMCVLLWETEGNGDLLAEYEDAVLALVPEHGGEVQERVRRTAVPGEPRGEDPLEVQVIELPDDAALAAYMADPRRTALADARDRAVARTQIVSVDRVGRR
ncbi:hypothetical protein GCM10025864_36410 [Luteimicrobium album]|uniref:DUF1330 domain-containing protein n=1 Tax=Luteimicrobium album TaxID=1054550 RepID=A0ABQ6I5Z3_9MICO|nr:hypothetical protein [Luteimicrobium album]GMA25882.1 hypothetical protein GCM10025864_36410 [Luteimicrobium album]